MQGAGRQRRGQRTGGRASAGRQGSGVTAHRQVSGSGAQCWLGKRPRRRPHSWKLVQEQVSSQRRSARPARTAILLSVGVHLPRALLLWWTPYCDFLHPTSPIHVCMAVLGISGQVASANW